MTFSILNPRESEQRGLPTHEAEAELDDGTLIRRAIDAGHSSLENQRVFLAYVAEIAERGCLGQLRGRDGAPKYVDVFEFAAREGGASRKQVRFALSLRYRLREFPRVWALYRSGKVGGSLLMRVPLDLLQKDVTGWIERFQSCSKKMIDAIVCESLRSEDGEAERDAQLTLLPLFGEGADRNASNESTSFDTDPGEEEGDPRASDGPSRQGVPKRPRPGTFLRLRLGSDVRKHLEEIRVARSREEGRRLTLEEAVEELILGEHLERNPESYLDLTEEERSDLRRRAREAAKRARALGPIPASVRRVVIMRSGGRCERPGCDAPVECLHHWIKVRARKRDLSPRLRDLPRHDPRAIAGLCSACHDLLHEGWIENSEAPIEEWRLRTAGGPGSPDHWDRRFREIRRSSKEEPHLDGSERGSGVAP